MNKQIVLDIETTGINLIEKHYIGHKIIEIGAIEIINRKITNNFIHFYINPKKKINDKAYKIHGINNYFLKNKPIFLNIANKLINFIKNKELIIHNANFDIKFIEYELKLINHKIKKIKNICKITDTLYIARKLFPGKKNNLNALCQRYNIDISKRKKHGALLDAKLLSIVYLNMTRKQNKINFLKKKNINKKNIKIDNIKNKNINFNKNNKNIKYIYIKKHLKYLKYIKKKNNKCLWLEKYKNN